MEFNVECTLFSIYTVSPKQGTTFDHNIIFLANIDQFSNFFYLEFKTILVLILNHYRSSVDQIGASLFL